MRVTFFFVILAETALKVLSNTSIDLNLNYPLISLGGLQISGDVAGDYLGASVSSAGDVNGDGVDDVIVGAYLADPSGRLDAGAAYVIYGKAGPGHIDLSTPLLLSQGFQISGGAADDYLGRFVSSAGDVNGDGVDDVIVGAFQADPSGRSNAGAAYVIYGKAGGLSGHIDLSTPFSLSQGFQISGSAAGDVLGWSVSSAGDVNEDGVDDVIVGAHLTDPSGRSSAGAAYVIYGKAGGLPGNIDLNTPLPLSQGFQISGGAAVDYLGVSVGSAGDVNGDGVGDVIVGASVADPSGRLDAGAAYVVYGKAGGLLGNIDLSTPLLLSQGFQISGGAAGDNLGYFVSSAGDINGDGVDDVIVGAFLADPSGRLDAGAAYVVYGKSGGLPSHIDLNTPLPLSQGFQISGGAAGDYLGYSVSSAGDINGDGVDDVIVGAYRADPSGRSNAGTAYVIYGKAGGLPGHIDLSIPLLLSQGFQINGGAAGDSLGLSVSSAGDVSGDGVDDVIIGALYADPSGRSNAGAVYVVPGKDGGLPGQIDLSPSLLLSQGFQISGGAAGDILGISVSSAGDVNGDGVDDVIAGAYQADPSGRSDAGAVYVIYGKAGGPPSHIDLNTPLLLSQGFQIFGGAANDILGVSVSSAGDVNGDGVDDVIVGAYEADPSGHSAAGTAYVIYGKAGGLPGHIDLSTPVLLSQGFQINGGAADDYLGYSVSSAGDVNGDGVDDVIIGATGVDRSGGPQAGAAYVIYGKAGGLPSHIDLSTPLLLSQGFQISGSATDDYLGGSVSSAGDVNGDGVDDVIVGASVADPLGRSAAGAAYVIYGKAGGLPGYIDLNTHLPLSQGFQISGGAADDNLGVSVSSAGDVNGDGVDDVIVGAYHADPSGRSDAGTAYMIYGKAGGLPSYIDLNTPLPLSQGFQIFGGAAGDTLGASVSSAGDINGDGVDDVIVGAYQADPSGRSNAGTAYVIYGKAGGLLGNIDLSTPLLPSQGFQISGGAADDNLGCSVSSAGDVNMDGVDDVIVGAYQADPFGRTQAGAAFIIYSPSPHIPVIYSPSPHSAPYGSLDSMSTVQSFWSQLSIVIVSILTLINFSNPAPSLFAVLADILWYIKYMTLQCPPNLQFLLDQPESFFLSIPYLSSVPPEIENQVSDHPLPYNFQKHEIHSSFLVNFWSSIMPLLLAGIGLSFAYLSLRMSKRCKAVNSKCANLKQSLQWNYLLGTFIQQYGPIAFYSSFELKTVQFESAFAIMSFAFCIIMNLIVIIVFIRIFLITRKLAQEKDSAKRDKIKKHYKDYQITFENFKSDSLSQQTFLSLSCLKIYLFNLILAYLYEHPLVQAIFFNAQSLAFMLYLFIKRPFLDQLELGTFFISELILEVVHACVLGLVVLSDTEVEFSATSFALADIIIYSSYVFSGFQCLFLGIQVIVLLINGMKFLRRRLTRHASSQNLRDRVVFKRPTVGSSQKNLNNELSMMTESRETIMTSQNMSHVDTSPNFTDSALLETSGYRSRSTIKVNQRLDKQRAGNMPQNERLPCNISPLQAYRQMAAEYCQRMENYDLSMTNQGHDLTGSDSPLNARQNRRTRTINRSRIGNKPKNSLSINRYNK